MTVGELINQLSRYPNQNAEVTIRLGWDYSGPRHYTRCLDDGPGNEPVIVASWSVTEPERDLADQDPLYRQ